MKDAAPRFYGSAHSSHGRPVPNCIRARGNPTLVPGDTVPSDCGLYARAVSPAPARAKVMSMGPSPVATAPGDAVNASPSIRPALGACTPVCGGGVAADRIASATRVVTASSSTVLLSFRAATGIDTCAARGSTSVVAVPTLRLRSIDPPRSRTPLMCPPLVVPL
jgi:hypothetical protein